MTTDSSDQPEPLPFVHRITKYDPADRDRSGCYLGSEDVVSDHGPVEAAYLEAIAAFADGTGIDHLAVREPHVAGFVNFGVEPPVPGHGLAQLFPPDLSGFHDGAEVSVAVALELVRAMLRDSGAWCRLEVARRFAVHVGYDQYVYVGSNVPCEAALERTRALGLFPERLDASPYDIEIEPGEQRPAADDFWDHLRWRVTTGPALLLEEMLVGNVSRWHRLTADGLAAVRSDLVPRAILTVWPDLSSDVEAVLASLPDEGLMEFVWEQDHGRISSVVADETEFAELAETVRAARAAAILPLDVEGRQPLLTAVLPDSDGVLRARWRTEPTASDRRWAVLKGLRPGQLRTGTVTAMADSGVMSVDLGGCIATSDVSGWSSQAPAAVGQEITATVLDVDLVRERVTLALASVEGSARRNITCAGPTTNSSVGYGRGECGFPDGAGRVGLLDQYQLCRQMCRDDSGTGCQRVHIGQIGTQIAHGEAFRRIIVSQQRAG